MNPVARLAPLDWMTMPETRAVLDALTARGAPARFVGGSVRDALLRRPVTDIDIATPERPEDVRDLLEGAGLRAIPTGLEHGTITGLSGDRSYEITTLRRDVETDGRRATVAFTDDWQADAARRDFTLNALFADPDGTIHDYFDGLADLYAGRVRFVGDAGQRIEEDVLRILRFFRCHALYGAGDPDGHGLEACAAAAPRLESLSGERVQTEMIKLLGAVDPVPVIAVMAARGVLAHILTAAWREPPAWEPLARLVALERRLGRADPIRRLSLLLDGEPAVREATDRLRLSNDARDRLLAMTAATPLTAGTDGPALRLALYRQGRDGVVDGILRAWARDGADDAFARLLAKAEGWPVPEFPLAGRDALALGMKPGPDVGNLLGEIEAWWVAQDFEPDRAALHARLSTAIAAKA
jgi:poly(A) polymerase